MMRSGTDSSGAVFAAAESRVAGQERRRLITSERKLEDDQEERWRAYLLLREVVLQSGNNHLRRRAVQLALHCLGGISERFERGSEIQAVEIELTGWIRHPKSRFKL